MAKSIFRLSAFADEASSNFDEQIEALKENRVGLIEVRGVNGKNVMDLTDEEAQEVRAKLDANGIGLSALGSPLGKIGIDDDFEEHMKKLRRAFELCRILGTDKIRMFSFYIPEGTDPASRRDDVFARIEAMIAAAEKEGILLCHENERAIYGEQPDKCVDLMEQFYPRMKNVFDPANYVVAKSVPGKSFPSLMQYTQYMHIKDAVLEDGAIVPSGAGDGSIKEILSQIGAYREDTVLTVEPHLTAFTGLGKLQHEDLRHKFSFADNKASFKAACDALKAVLSDLGYTEDKTQLGVWTKEIEKETKTMDTVRIGIIGVGNMGSSHAQSIFNGKVEGLTLTAIADINPARLEWAKATVPGVALFDDAEKMMDSGLVDAVIVATPHYFHPGFVKMALSKGLHALSEKPAGVFTKEVRELNEYAAKCDKTYAIMFNQRTNCIYRKMREIVQSGEMGQIRRTNWLITNWYRSQSYYDSGAWRATWDGEGGGVLLNQCPHNLDLWQWICGMPVRVRSFMKEGKWHDIEVEDDVTTYVEYENGATGVFITTTGDCPGTNRFEITMDGGKIVAEDDKLTLYKLEMPEPEFSRTWKNGFGTPKCEVINVETDGLNPQHNEVLRAFGAHIQRGEPLVAPGEEGIRGLTLSNAMHLSAWQDKTIELPLDEDAFLEELNKRRATSRRKTGEAKVLNTEGTYNSK